MCEFCNLFQKLCNTLWLIRTHLCLVTIQLQLNLLLLRSLLRSCPYRSWRNSLGREQFHSLTGLTVNDIKP